MDQVFTPKFFANNGFAMHDGYRTDRMGTLVNVQIASIAGRCVVECVRPNLTQILKEGITPASIISTGGYGGLNCMPKENTVVAVA